MKTSSSASKVKKKKKLKHITYQDNETFSARFIKNWVLANWAALQWQKDFNWTHSSPILLNTYLQHNSIINLNKMFHSSSKVINTTFSPVQTQRSLKHKIAFHASSNYWI